MRIIFFIDSLAAGGKERRLTELIKGLQKRQNVTFEIVVMNNDVHFTEIFDLGINIHFIIRKSKKDFSVFFQLHKICKQFKPDIIHCWDSMTAVYSVPVSKLLGIKLVNGMIVDCPSVRNYRNKTWLRGKLTFPFSNMIIGNSNEGLSAYGVSKKKSVCIYNGFNFDRIQNVSNQDLIRQKLSITTKYVVGMVASFSIYKDYKTYYKAAELILKKRNDVTFLAVGDKTDSAESVDLNNKTFLPFMRLVGRQSDVESYIAAMDVCVLSTFTEGISNSILEYMASAKPVVATDGGGTKEIVTEGKTGFLVNAESPEALAERITQLLESENLRREMGESGKFRVFNDFSIDRMVDQYVVHYRKLSGK